MSGKQQLNRDSPRLGGRRQRGLSLIELMVGITVGMIVVAAASLMMTTQLKEHKLLVLETQLQQDLRAAGDLMLKDMRRAGFWAMPQNGVWAEGSFAAPASNPYANVSTTGDAQSGKLEYQYSRHFDERDNSFAYTNPEDSAVDTNERFGFKLDDGVLKIRLGTAWQPLTDPATLTVTSFQVNLQSQNLALQEFCDAPCPAGTVCPSLQVRQVNITLVGQAVHDSSVVRKVQLSGRIRNDGVVGSCPAPA
ncbi:MAG: prepilin-type N-terminal cleavage/methylation domain-containing protein [Paucibacter sp.]|nr:prepilin-type N-terminal cleavage/methylation domain-containing protein [Roseateles sp.]